MEMDRAMHVGRYLKTTAGQYWQNDFQDQENGKEEDRNEDDEMTQYNTLALHG